MRTITWKQFKMLRTFGLVANQSTLLLQEGYELVEIREPHFTLARSTSNVRMIFADSMPGNPPPNPYLPGKLAIAEGERSFRGRLEIDGRVMPVHTWRSCDFGLVTMRNATESQLRRQISYACLARHRSLQGMINKILG